MDLDAAHACLKTVLLFPEGPQREMALQLLSRASRGVEIGAPVIKRGFDDEEAQRKMMREDSPPRAVHPLVKTLRIIAKGTLGFPDRVEVPAFDAHFFNVRAEEVGVATRKDEVPGWNVTNALPISGAKVAACAFCQFPIRLSDKFYFEGPYHLPCKLFVEGHEEESESDSDSDSDDEGMHIEETLRNVEIAVVGDAVQVPSFDAAPFNARAAELELPTRAIDKVPATTFEHFKEADGRKRLKCDFCGINIMGVHDFMYKDDDMDYHLPCRAYMQAAIE